MYQYRFRFVGVLSQQQIFSQNIALYAEILVWAWALYAIQLARFILLQFRQNKIVWYLSKYCQNEAPPHRWLYNGISTESLPIIGSTGPRRRLYRGHGQYTLQTIPSPWRSLGMYRSHFELYPNVRQAKWWHSAVILVRAIIVEGDNIWRQVSKCSPTVKTHAMGSPKKVVFLKQVIPESLS